MEALTFVARRLEAEPAALLFAGRDEPRLTERAAGVPVLRLPGLAPEAAASLLQTCVARADRPGRGGPDRHGHRRQPARPAGPGQRARRAAADRVEPGRRADAGRAHPRGVLPAAGAAPHARPPAVAARRQPPTPPATSTSSAPPPRSSGLLDVVGEGAELAGLVTLGAQGRVPASAGEVVGLQRRPRPRPTPTSTAPCRRRPPTSPSSSSRPGTRRRPPSAPTQTSPTGSSGSPTWRAPAAASSPAPAFSPRPRP